MRNKITDKEKNDKEKVAQIIDEMNCTKGIGATDEEISQMETELGLSFPSEYREFLSLYGWLEPLLIEAIFGGGKDAPREHSVVQQTQELRELYPETFAKNLAAIYWLDGNYRCVVCDGNDRGKVIFWQHDLSAGEVYPNDPDFWIEALNFWEWLRKKIETAKEAEKETEKEFDKYFHNQR